MLDTRKMDAEDFFKLYLFCKSGIADKSFYEDYVNNFNPTPKDVDNYNKKLGVFEDAFGNYKSKVHKYIGFRQPKQEVKKDNDFEFCARIGHEFEIFVEQECKKYGVELGMYYDERQFKGENELGLEIKHDGKLAETGNVYIECLALNRDETKFINGGILKEDNSKYWIIGTPEEYYIFYKKTLLKIAQNYLKEPGVKPAQRRTSKGIVISRKRCKELMIADDIGEFLLKVGLIEI